MDWLANADSQHSATDSRCQHRGCRLVQLHLGQREMLLQTSALFQPDPRVEAWQHKTLQSVPILLASLGTTLSLSSTVPPSPPPGPHCVFITIKESLPCLTIRLHYAMLCFVTLVTVWSVIWLLLMQDFRARALLGLAERDTHTHVRTNRHARTLKH